MKLRRCFFTWNNWQDDFKDKEAVEQYFQNLAHIRGYLIGFEIGDKEKTPHLQGLLFFNQQKTFNTLREYLKNNHIEKIISLKDAIEYVKKDGEFIEFGDLPTNQGKRNDIHEFRDAIIRGDTDLELLENYPSQFFRFQNQIDNVRQLILEEHYSKHMRTNLKVIYIYGPAGSGKTSSIYKHFSPTEIYRVINYKHPFDSYNGQKVLVFDEFNSQIQINQFLNYLDIYPLQLPARYRDRWASYEIVFIISNYPLDKQYKYIDDELYKALYRRIHYEFELLNTDESRDNLELLIKNDILLPF